jgi:hypothetical protein
MSEVETEKSTMGGWKAAAILGATALVGIWSAVTVLPVVAAHLVLSAIVLGGAAAAVGYKKERRDSVLSFGSKVKDFYKDAFKGFKAGWKKSVAWAEEREAAAKAAREADSGTSPLASKEAANDFDAAASGAKVTVKKAPAPVAKPTARPGM